MVVTKFPGERPLPSIICIASGSIPFSFQKSTSTSTPFRVLTSSPSSRARVFIRCSPYKLILLFKNQYITSVKPGELWVAGCKTKFHVINKKRTFTTQQNYKVMGRPKKEYKLSREEIIEILKLELEHEVNAMLDKLDKTEDGYEYEQIAISGFSRFNNKWMQEIGRA